MIRFLVSLFLITLTVTLHAQSNKAKLANEYYQQGELEKAFDLYENLEKDKTAIPLIHSNYLNLLIQIKDYKAGQKYLNRITKMYPSNLQYQVDQSHFYLLTNQLDKKERYQSDLISNYGSNQYQLSSLAQNFVSKQMYDDALLFYQMARKANGRSSAFALDMAALHRLRNDKEQMTFEYINYAESNPSNISYVKNLFQNLLTEDQDKDFLESTLLQKIQRYPNNDLYSDLLIWLELQRKNFYAAFIQARAIDRRNKQPGDQSMRIARVAFDNRSWQDVIDICEYVVGQYSDSYNYTHARRMLIRAKESKIKSEYPVDTLEIRNLVNEYGKLFDEIGANPSTLQALRNKSLLHAFYLNEMDSATRILQYIIKNRRSTPQLISESKLDLGDIHILIGEPWEATLLYSQVEKANKESPLGYEAKLRNARLNYYTGNFSLAKSHLDILKLATTREIANDALALSLLISDNTALDTTDAIMEEFAGIELLIFTNQKEDAMKRLNGLLENNPGHSITDEVYWLQARLEMERGDYFASIEKLDLIIKDYGYDILSDDAFFQKGIILQEYLHQDKEAEETFKQFLKRYPGSRLAAEARVRVRQLRGDQLN